MQGDSHRPTRLPFVSTSEQEGTVPGLGGDVTTFIADIALNVGDTVYYSAVGGHVTKSAVIANYARLIAGVVVGGTKTFMNALTNSADVGVAQAAAIGEYVLVQQSGLVQVLSDAAIAAIGAVIPGAGTAGRVGAGTTAGSILGTTLNTAAGAGTVIVVDINRS